MSRIRCPLCNFLILPDQLIEQTNSGFAHSICVRKLKGEVILIDGKWVEK